ncbi:MAG: class I SAM-dependent methyltransferase [Hyphomonadaceae bacterium]|nr:class I SAM-dependent methyltransferase [Hyphomonadaceae bacterium]
MDENRICNLCEYPGTFEGARDVGRVRSNVREFLHERFTVWRCTHCGSLHSLEAIDYSRYYRDYPLRRQKLDFAARRFFSQRLSELRMAGVKPSSSILDFGCGNGSFVRFLRERGYANAQGYEPYSSEYDDPRVLKDRFDIVTSQDVLEHVPSPKDYLKELRSMVRPGGLLAVGTPDAAELRIDDPLDESGRLHQPFHRHLITRDLLAQLMTQGGATIIHEARRYYVDTWIPFLNSSFLFNYMHRTGGAIDAGLETIRLGTIMASPALLFRGLLGRFLQRKQDVLIVVRIP